MFYVLSLRKVEVFPAWTTLDPHDSLRRVYLYSAIIALHTKPPAGTDVHFLGFQDGKHPTNLTCCAKLLDQTVHRGKETTIITFGKGYRSYYDRRVAPVGHIYRCNFPFTAEQLRSAHVTLTKTYCPENTSRYLKVHAPEVKPGGLAICGKLAYGHMLNTRKLVEWFETQRLLGVDKIQIFSYNISGISLKVFKHYEDLGLLNLLPYKLPGQYVLK